MNKTKGHLQNNGGVRGHSKGEFFPFIVYNVGGSWVVKKPDGSDYPDKFFSAEAAHAKARKEYLNFIN